MTSVLLQTEHRWVCPNCTFTDITYESNPHSRMHSCAGLHGFSVPMVPDGTKCKVEAIERGDYVGSELVQADGESRPIASVVITRDTGQDCAVYAPTAVAHAKDIL